MPLFSEEKMELGALPDNRPISARRKDFTEKDLPQVAGAPAPFNNQRIRELQATVFNQWHTSSCVPHGFLTQLEYEGIISKASLKSQLRAYRKRANYPQPGSIGIDMYDKIRAGVSPLSEALVMSEHTEAQANALPLMPGVKPEKDFSYYTITDYSKISTLIASGKAVAVFIYANKKEWSREYVELQESNLDISKAGIRHCVVLIPRGDFTKDGIEYYSVHDSSKFGNRHLRYMPHSFLLKRCYFAAEVFPKGAEPMPEPPGERPLPLISCELEMNGDAVLDLQAYLIKKGFLEPQYLTGYYGALTAKAVLWFQLMNHEKFASNIPKLLEWRGEYWGRQSIDVVKSLT